MARRAVHSRYFEKRHDSAGRVLWYQLRWSPGETTWTPTRVRAPRAFRSGDKLLDLTADEPTKQVRRGGEWRDTPLSARALRYWVENRIPASMRRAPAVERARRGQLAAIRRGVNPDDIGVWQRRADGSERRFTVSSWARFMTQDKYQEARSRMEDADDDFVLGVRDEDGALGEVLDELGGVSPWEDEE